jgi:hypothetical protein
MPLKIGMEKYKYLKSYGMHEKVCFMVLCKLGFIMNLYGWKLELPTKS